jgi:hypothetical protein
VKRKKKNPKKHTKPARRLAFPCKFALGLMHYGNAPGSATKRVPLSKFEALLLVEYWVAEYEACDYWRNIQYSSSGERIFDHARWRIIELRDAGLVTQKQITQIVDKIYDQHDKRWKELHKTQDAWRKLGEKESSNGKPYSGGLEIGC